ncbi:MAG: ABC transporter ATP-binding protein [Phycisphaerae bacterium]|nr:ABC transporter ATP-binding protein [Phycisphaerae bacterium]
MLELRAITKSYPTAAGELKVLSELDLSLAPGENVAIIGPSGSGKTTLLNILGLLEPPSRGEYRIDEANLLTLAPADAAAYRNRSIGFIFQDHHLLPQLNVLENVLLPTWATASPPAGAITRANALLDQVGLAARKTHRPAELSGGERQRVAIARALINQPKLLIADEPTGNLDPRTATQIADLLLESQRAAAARLILVTHSIELAGRFARRLRLQDGRLHEVASS